MRHVGVEKHCAVHDAASGQMVESVAAHFTVVDENVIASVVAGIQPQLFQHLNHRACVARESEFHIVAASDVTHHNVAHVGKHAASATFSAIGGNAMLAAVGNVHFIGYKLVSSENYGRIHLPHKEYVIIFDDACGIFLHCQIEWKNASVGLR